MKFHVILSVLLFAFPTFAAFAKEKILAKCEATQLVCVLKDEQAGGGVFFYRDGEPKVREELTELGELIAVNISVATAVFTKDGKYLLMEGGTGSAGHDFTIYKHVKGLEFKMVNDLAVSVPMQNLAFGDESEEGWLDHSYVKFAGWAAPHVMRARLSGRGRIDAHFVTVNGWEGLFNLDTLKASPLPKAIKAGKIKRTPAGEM